MTPGDVVLAVDSRAANEWPQVVRGMCGVPALSTTSALRADPVAAGLDRRGGVVARSRPAAAGSCCWPPTRRSDRRLGVGPDAVTDTTVREDEHVLEQRPSHTDPLPVRVWLAPAP